MTFCLFRHTRSVCNLWRNKVTLQCRGALPSRRGLAHSGRVHLQPRGLVLQMRCASCPILQSCNLHLQFLDTLLQVAKFLQVCFLHSLYNFTMTQLQQFNSLAMLPLCLGRKKERNSLETLFLVLSVR